MLEFELIGGGDDLISLRDERGLDLDFDHSDEVERCFDVLSSILDLIDERRCLGLLFLDHEGECCGFVALVMSSDYLAEATDRDITLETKQIHRL